jgi:hypothetical protein
MNQDKTRDNLWDEVAPDVERICGECAVAVLAKREFLICDGCAAAFIDEAAAREDELACLDADDRMERGR